jgi:tyrosyl-tRNA synthetase
MDLYKLASITSEHDAKKAGAEVVKQSAAAPLVSGPV